MSIAIQTRDLEIRDRGGKGDAEADRPITCFCYRNRTSGSSSEPRREDCLRCSRLRVDPGRCRPVSLLLVNSGRGDLGQIIAALHAEKF